MNVCYLLKLFDSAFIFVKYFESPISFYCTAERKQSLGYDWHPECPKCEECRKHFNTGQHAEAGQ